MNAAFDPYAFLAEALRLHGPAPQVASVFEAATLSLEEAEAKTSEGVGRFFSAALEWRITSTALWRRQKRAKARLKEIREDQGFIPAEETDEQRQLNAVLREVGPIPPQHGLQVGLGIGKTFQSIMGARDYIAAAKRAKVAPGILWTTLTLAMADQTAADHRKVGTVVGVYRGRNAPNPLSVAQPVDENDDAGRMCLDLPAVRLARDADLSVSTHVCGSGKPDKPNCQFRDECPFQRNNMALRKADVVVSAHAALFHTLDAALERRIGLTIIDEGFWQHGLLTSSIPLEGLISDFDVAPVLNKEGEPLSFATQQLRATMNEAHRVLEALPDGKPLGRDMGGLDAVRCRDAASDQFNRIVKASMYPGMPLEDRREAAKQGSRNRQFRGMSALLHALAEHLDSRAPLCGRIEMELADLKAGPERRVLIHGRKDFVAHTARGPVFHLDATMPVAAVQMYLPRLDVPPPVEAVTPHMTVVQVLSTRDNRGGFGKTSVIPHPDLREDEIRRREGRLAEMRDFFAGMAQRLGPGLVITYKALRPYFADLEGVALGNFNAIAGLNSYLDVSWVVILGRPMPGPRDTALTCKQLFGRWAEPVSPEEVPVGLLMAVGSRHTIQSRRFANKDMEAVRAAIADNNVVQSVGRPRGVRRTAESPVLVMLMTDVAAPFPVHQVTNWPDLSPDVVQRMAARGAVLTSPKDAAKAYPDLFPSPDAARMAMSRVPAFTEQTHIISLSVGVCSVNQFASVRYRPEGRGQQTRTGHVLESRLPGCRDWLESLVGPLALFEVVRPDPEIPPAVRSPLPPIPDVEELPMSPPERTPPTSLPADRLEPAAVYPIATDQGWHDMPPVVSFITVSGRSPRSGGYARHPIGCANIRAVREEQEALWRGAWLPPPEPFMPPEWIADAEEDIGGPYERGWAARDGSAPPPVR